MRIGSPFEPIVVGGFLAAVLLIAGCDGKPPPSADRSAVADTNAASSGMDDSRPTLAQADAESGSDQAEGGDAATDTDQVLGQSEAEATEPRNQDADDARDTTGAGRQEPEPRLPDYLAVVERFRPREPAVVRSRLEGVRRIVLQTENVSRLRIYRRELSMPAHRSIVVRIDDQGIEWTPTFDVLELVRSRHGAWTPLKKIKPETP